MYEGTSTQLLRCNNYDTYNNILMWSDFFIYFVHYLWHPNETDLTHILCYKQCSIYYLHSYIFISMTWMCKFSPKWCFVPTHEVCLDPRTRRPSRPTCSSVILPFSPPPSPSSRPYHRVGLILSFVGTRLSDIHTLHRFVTTENKIQSGINPVL